MKKYVKFNFLLLILIFLSGCKALEKSLDQIKNNLQKQPSQEKINDKNSIEISVSCGDDSDFKKYISEGWKIVKEHSEEKICSWKSVPASKDCDMEKDKGCKLIKPDLIGEEKIYLLEK